MRHLFCFILIIVIGGTAHATSLRIVSLAPALTEIIATLNLTANLVGISSDSDYPESVKGITPVGAFLQPSFERIAGVRPTLILGMGQPNGPAFRQLQANGTRVVLFNSPDQITDIYSIIRQIGDLTNRQARAGQVIRSLKSQMAEIEKNRPTVSPTVMVVIWHPPITVAAANTFIGDMVKRAGGSNSIEGSRIRYPQMERELMMYKNPTVIIVADPSVADAVRKDVTFRSTAAYRRGFIVSDISPNLLLRPGPRFPQAVRELQRVFNDAVPHD